MENKNIKKPVQKGKGVATAVLLTTLAVGTLGGCGRDRDELERKEMDMLRRQVSENPTALETVDKNGDSVPQTSELIEAYDGINGKKDGKLSYPEIRTARSSIRTSNARQEFRQRIDGIILSAYQKAGYDAVPEGGITYDAYRDYLQGKKMSNETINGITELIEIDVANWTRVHGKGAEKGE